MNKKRHTLLKKRLSIASVLIPCFLLFGCARDIPPVAIPVAPIKRESAAPHFIKVNSGIDSTIKSNTKIGEKIKEQKRELVAQKLTITETITEAEKLLSMLKDYKCVSDIEIINVVDGLHVIETRNLFLEKQNNELEALRYEQEEILKMTKEDATITYRKLLDKENEADALRDQNDYLGKNLKLKNEEAETLKQKVKDVEVKLAKANVYKYWVWGLVGGFLLWTIIKNVLMIYSPMTKFRI
ncbi:MAG: hypothetical protein HQK53_13540 [Oligoflexia bacterium]|nr:hypothetical protein [Oligoflexia bacterium]